MARHLEGKTAIVTGGAGGIGSWVSKLYAENGAKVIVADTGADVEGRMGLDPSRVNAVVDEITAAGGEAIATVGDVSEMDVAEGLVRTALERWGKLDILCCAHGILRERMIFNMTEDEWDGSVKSHLKGCFAPTKFASIHWRQERQGGRVIYFTSGAGIHGSSGQPNYSAAHAAKLGLMRSNARGLSRYGVTSNCIAPGASTRMTDRGLGVGHDGPAPSESAAGTARDPKNVAPIAVWLASDAGGAANGRIFGARGHVITLYSEPARERTLRFAEPFIDIDELFELWPQTLGSEPLEEDAGLDLDARQLADRQAIVEVIDRYATSLDAKDYERFKTCFSEDALVHYADDLVGPEPTAAYAESVLSQFAHTQHLLGNYAIALDGDRASARTYMHASHVTSEGAIWVVGGTYIDRFERRDGDWKIVERALEAKWSERRTISA